MKRAVLIACAFVLVTVAVPSTFGQGSAAPTIPQAQTALPESVKVFHAAGPMPSYEVATIKRPDTSSNYASGYSAGLAASGGGGGATIRGYIQSAYGIPIGSKARVVGGPAWISSDAYIIQGKVPDEIRDAMQKMTPADRLNETRMMQQMLLQERFKLKVHWETRDGQAYDLVVAKAGRLRSSGAGPSAEELKQFGDRPIPPLYQKGSSMRGFEYIGHGATTDEITSMLAMQMGRPVSDKTGLSGKYDFDLKYYQTKASDRKDDETNPWPPLETAIQDQLGLKLAASHGPGRFLVIDHIEMPSAN